MTQAKPRGRLTPESVHSPLTPRGPGVKLRRPRIKLLSKEGKNERSFRNILRLHGVVPAELSRGRSLYRRPERARGEDGVRTRRAPDRQVDARRSGDVRHAERRREGALQ